MHENQKKDMLLRLRGELDILKEEIRTDVLGPVIASFGFIIALVWRDAIRSVIDEFLNRMGLVEQLYIYEVISAIIVTFVVIIIMIFTIKLSRKKKKKQLEKKIENKTQELKQQTTNKN
ncbi:MAG: DUF5654 family protein [Candidatus Nanoarchaeia archaeon]